jgi:limonene-1,2-epoxide hydrolase
MNNPMEVIDAMIAGWTKRDVKAIMACFSADAIWNNIPYRAIAGRDAIETSIAAFLGTVQSVEFKIHHAGMIGPDIVVNERSDIFVNNEGRRIDLQVMGIFEVHEGLITHWRDYFDAKAMAGEPPSP